MNSEKRTINEKGATLTLALLFLFLLTALGLSIVLNSQIENLISSNYSKTVRATFAAETGIERIKPYLLYDLQKDPAGWSNQYLWVPDGTAGALEGGSADCPGIPATRDCFNLGTTSTTPYDVVNSIADAQTNAIWAPENPEGWGTYGYQLMFRNVPAAVGMDRNKICVLSGGFTDPTISMMGQRTRGANLLEQCFIGEDLSIWNNIIFVEGGATSGMGNFKIHGNVHILGPSAPVPSSDINVEVKGNQGWYNDYTSGSPLTSTLGAVLDPAEASRTSLEAKIRDKNGLIDAQNGSVEFGTFANPFDAVFGCGNCSGILGFTSFAWTLVSAIEQGPYDVPAQVLSKMKVPVLSDPYTDEREVLYPDYEDYLIGTLNAGGISGNNLPGILGLRLASALNMPGNNVISFSNDNSFVTLLSDSTKKNAIFAANVNTASNPNLIQQTLDPVNEASLLDSIFAPNYANTSGNTFLLIAHDVAAGVLIVYKEVQPFDRTVDKDLSGPAGFASLHTGRQVHGLVFAEHNALPSNLVVDLDGNDLDGVNGDHSLTLDPTQSQRLLRKVINALWRASKGSCMADSSTPCYVQASDSSYDFDLSPDLSLSGNLYTADAPKLVGSGVIQMTDQVEFGDEGLRYAGRFSFFSEETGGSSSATSSGYVDMNEGPRPVQSYVAAGNTYSFPCNNSMGIMAANRIDLGNPSGTHDEFAGAFYAGFLLTVQKQIQILGAIVSKDFDLAGGGNPDWFQAMQISRCLPPEMIGKEPVVYIRSASYLDR